MGAVRGRSVTLRVFGLFQALLTLSLKGFFKFILLMDLAMKDESTSSSMMVYEVQNKLEETTISKLFTCSFIGESFIWSEEIKEQTLSNIQNCHTIEALKNLLFELPTLTNVEVKEIVSSRSPTFLEYRSASIELVKDLHLFSFWYESWSSNVASSPTSTVSSQEKNVQQEEDTGSPVLEELTPNVTPKKELKTSTLSPHQNYNLRSRKKKTKEVKTKERNINGAEGRADSISSEEFQLLASKLSQMEKLISNYDQKFKYFEKNTIVLEKELKGIELENKKIKRKSKG